MTVRVLTGSKSEIAEKLASLEGDVRQAIVFILRRERACFYNRAGEPMARFLSAPLCFCLTATICRCVGIIW